VYFIVKFLLEKWVIMAKKFKHTDIDVLYELPKKINKSLLERGNIMARKAVRILRAEIKKKAFFKGDLMNSVDYVTDNKRDSVGFQIVVSGEAAKYDEFQDEGGVQTSFPNIDRLMNWLKNKKGRTAARTLYRKNSAVKNRQKKKDSLRRMAYALALTIQKKGIKPKDFYEPAMNEIDDMVNKEIGKWAHSFQMK